MKKVFECSYQSPLGKICFVSLYADNREEASCLAAEYFDDVEYTPVPIERLKFIEVKEIDMGDNKDIANREEWDREADEEAWAAEAAAATARRAQSNG